MIAISVKDRNVFSCWIAIPMVILFAQCQELKAQETLPRAENRMNELLQELEDVHLDPRKRVEAAAKLGEMGKFILRDGKDTVPHMLALLPGDWDGLTREIVVSLGKIGDQRAVPVLKRMKDPVGVDVHSKIRLAVEWSLHKLEEKASEKKMK